MDIMDLFPTRVMPEPNSGCWLWTGTVDGSGYGVFKKAGRMVAAHRKSLELATGAPIAGVMALHNCHQRLCVNPAHLRVGAHLENMEDMRRAHRQVYGARHWSSRLTETQVREIRAAFSQPYRGLTVELARRYGVHEATVRDINKGRKWRHVQ